MRRLMVLVVALVSFVLGAPVVALAQEATPASDAGGLTPLAQVVVEELPSAPAEIFFARLTLEPGASFPFDPTDPGLALAYVETGVFTFLAATDIRVTRVVVAGTPVAEEVAVAGVEVELRQGDSAVFPPLVAGEARNTGAVPVVLLLAGVVPTGAAGAATPVVGTPAAEGTPLGEEDGPPAGLSFQGLAFGHVDQLPAGPAILGIGRLTLGAGASIPPHPHPGIEFSVVEAGRATISVSEGQVEIIRGITTATPGPEAPETETVGAGQEVTLEAGDSVVYQPGTVADLRNEGDTPLLLLGGGIDPLAGEMATPTS